MAMSYETYPAKQCLQLTFSCLHSTEGISVSQLVPSLTMTINILPLLVHLPLRERSQETGLEYLGGWERVCAHPAVSVQERNGEKLYYKVTNNLPVSDSKVRLRIVQDYGSPYSTLCISSWKFFLIGKSENVSLCFIFMCIPVCPQTNLSSVRS